MLILMLRLIQYHSVQNPGDCTDIQQQVRLLADFILPELGNAAILGPTSSQIVFLFNSKQKEKLGLM